MTKLRKELYATEQLHIKVRMLQYRNTVWKRKRIRHASSLVKHNEGKRQENETIKRKDRNISKTLTNCRENDRKYVNNQRSPTGNN